MVIIFANNSYDDTMISHFLLDVLSKDLNLVGYFNNTDTAICSRGKNGSFITSTNPIYELNEQTLLMGIYPSVYWTGLDSSRSISVSQDFVDSMSVWLKERNMPVHMINHLYSASSVEKISMTTHVVKSNREFKDRMISGPASALLLKMDEYKMSASLTTFSAPLQTLQNKKKSKIVSQILKEICYFLSLEGIEYTFSDKVLANCKKSFLEHAKEQKILEQHYDDFSESDLSYS